MLRAIIGLVFIVGSMYGCAVGVVLQSRKVLIPRMRNVAETAMGLAAYEKIVEDENANLKVLDRNQLGIVHGKTFAHLNLQRRLICLPVESRLMTPALLKNSFESAEYNQISESESQLLQCSDKCILPSSVGEALLYFKQQIPWTFEISVDRKTSEQSPRILYSRDCRSDGHSKPAEVAFVDQTIGSKNKFRKWLSEKVNNFLEMNSVDKTARKKATKARVAESAQDDSSFKQCYHSFDPYMTVNRIIEDMNHRENDIAQDLSRVYASVLDFRAPENYIYVPNWIMDSLSVSAFDVLDIRLVTVRPAGLVTLRPLSDSWYRLLNEVDSDGAAASKGNGANNVITYLENEISRYSVLTEGMVIPLVCQSGERCPILVSKTQGDNGVRLRAVRVQDADVRVNIDLGSVRKRL